jgi:3-dehydroquinate dehydratase/shikimate dehydrogenase
MSAAEQEYKDGNCFLEFRTDYLPDPAQAIEVIRKFRRKYPDAVVLATCRRKQNRGGFSGSVANQIAVLKACAETGASIVDVEIETAECGETALAGLRETAALIISFHDWEKTPALDPLLRRLQRVRADAYKVVTTARKPTDNLRLMQFVRERRSNHLIAVAMSETGTPTRILGPWFGSIYTYAAPLDGNGTAAGQVPARVMRTLYRPDKLGRQTRVFGVIANPVAHSKSPSIHNRALQALRIDAVYLPFLVGPVQLGDWMKFAAGLPVAGFSVTIPHKLNISRYLDVVEPRAKRIGAVNTVWRKSGKWRGTNTDVDGVIRPLSNRLRLAKARVLIAGYGGAARAAAIALKDEHADISITGRNPKSAVTLARGIGANAVSLEQAQTEHYDALIHATPVGMYPKTEDCLFRDKIPADLVFDMVYNPRHTKLLEHAADQGCQTISGCEMLLEQAVSQFEIFTGLSAPRAIMQAALDQAR